ncbi:hypothetical protein [Actinacidiphila acididurans]|nr:hypothetical protein [Actinacidiphila acididurans]
MTTRIRINIPGSRPIPPVVVRTPVENPAPGAQDDPTGQQPLPAAAEERPAEPEKAKGKEKASDWFAPRKSQPSPAPGATPPGGMPAAGAAGPAAPGATGPGARPGSGRRGAPDPIAAAFSSPPATDPFGDTGVDPFTDTAAAPGPFRDSGSGPGTHAAPDPFTDTGADPFRGTAPGADPFRDTGSGTRPGADPFTDTGVDPFTDTGAAAGPFGRPQAGPTPAAAEDGARGPHDTPAEGFASPFSAPGSGSRRRTPDASLGTDDFPPGVPRPSDPLAPPAADNPFAPPAGQERSPFPPRTPGATGPDPFAPPATDEPFPGYQPPAGPTTGPATGPMRMPGAPAADFRQSPEFTPPGGDVSGDTLVSGIPVVPPAETQAPRPQTDTGESGPAAPAPAKAAKPAKPAKKGRSKLVLLGVGLGGVVVIAYGAGLLMDHAEVPKGTTVLGVDIGDKNKAAAVKTLDAALGNRTTAPLTLTIGDRKESLKPSVAGLSVDTDATVRKVAHPDYNPVSVIGSLFGQTRKADPVILVDEDKLKVALQGIAGRGSAGSDAMVRFADGKAIGVPGKPSNSFDVNAAASQVAAAYRNRAATGVNQPVALTEHTVPPKVGQAELDKAVNGFGRTAMSGFVTVRAGGHSITFGPNKSLPKFLSMVANPDGTLAPHIDLTVLQSLYGSTFDGVLLQRGNGTTTAVTPQDVATALIPALNSTKAADRDVTLPNVASG